MPRALLLNKCTGIRGGKKTMSIEYIQVIFLDCKGTEYCFVFEYCVLLRTVQGLYAILVFI